MKGKIIRTIVLAPSRLAFAVSTSWMGQTQAREASNGLVCLADRSWMSPFDSSDFWNPRVSAPICFNPPAARSVMPLSFKRAELALAGFCPTRMIAGIKEAFEKKELTTPEHRAIGYMMSKESDFGDSYPPALPHLMLYCDDLHCPGGQRVGWDAGSVGTHAQALTLEAPIDSKSPDYAKKIC